MVGWDVLLVLLIGKISAGDGVGHAELIVVGLVFGDDKFQFAKVCR